MKLLNCINTLWNRHGGPSVSVPQLCSSLSDLGHEVRIMTLAGPLSDAALKARSEGVIIEEFPWFGREFSPAFAKGIANRSADADLIHDHGLWRHVNWSAGRTARRFKKPFIITTLGLLAPSSLAHSRLQKAISAALFDKRNLRYARCIHVCSETEYRSVRAYGLSNPIAIIPNGLDYSVFESGGASALAEQHPELTGKRVLLFFSRISWEKGVTELIDAWGKLARVFPDWQLVIVGVGKPGYEQKIRSRIRDMELSNRVTWAGPLYGPAKISALSAADLFVLPSYSESFGLAILEALAAGVPVVTTQGTPWESLAREKCGWWIPTGVQPLVETLQKAMGLPAGALQEMGFRAKTLARSGYAWKPLAQLMEGVYRWVLNGGQAPECVRLD